MAVIKYLPGKKSLKSQLKYLEKEGKTLEELKIGINCTSDNIEKEFNIVGVASGKCGFTTLRAFSPLIPRVYRLFIYLMAYVIL